MTANEIYAESKITDFGYNENHNVYIADSQVEAELVADRINGKAIKCRQQSLLRSH